MYNHNKAQQSKDRVHISWDILYTAFCSNLCLANKRLFKAYSNFLAKQAGLTSGNPQLMGIVAVIITLAIYYCTYFHAVP